MGKAKHGAALPIDAVNRMGVQLDNIDIQVDRELSAEGLGRMITSSHNGVVRVVFCRFATGRKRPEAVIRNRQNAAKNLKIQLDNHCASVPVPKTVHALTRTPSPQLPSAK